MRRLLDTHVVLWWLSDDPTLSEETKTLIDEEPKAHLSAATLWEVTIKHALGRRNGAGCTDADKSSAQPPDR